MGLIDHDKWVLLQGRTIEKATNSDEEVVLILDNGTQLVISLGHDEYSYVPDYYLVLDVIPRVPHTLN